ncbi:MAG: hypothetical protein IJR67_00030 [Acholeplasmatales bacterium]|nr:hypothetical protein [Acholeplasmatales bacterium]
MPFVYLDTSINELVYSINSGKWTVPIGNGMKVKHIYESLQPDELKSKYELEVYKYNQWVPLSISSNDIAEPSNLMKTLTKNNVFIGSQYKDCVQEYLTEQLRAIQSTRKCKLLN